MFVHKQSPKNQHIFYEKEYTNSLNVADRFDRLWTKERQLDVFTDLYEEGTQISVKAGYLNLEQSIEDSGDEASSSKSGYYAGIGSEFWDLSKIRFSSRTGLCK